MTGGGGVDAPADTATAVPAPRATPWGIFAGCWVLLLCVAITPAVGSLSFTPKYAVDLVFAGVGIVPLVLSLKRSPRSIASLAAVGFLAVGLISALTSVAPGIGIFGLYLWGTGWLLWLAAAGAFGIGQRLTSADVPWVIGGLLVGAIANALMSVYQTVWVPRSGTFGPYQGNQAQGLLGNPIHLEALLLGAIGVLAMVACRSWRSVWWSVAPLMLMAVALEFSTERLAIILLVALFAVLIVRERLRGFALSCVIGLGYVIGYVGGHTNLRARVSEGASSPGFSLRLDIWKDALRAAVHRPLIGYGPGEFEAATAPHISQSFAEKLPAGSLFTDAHDFFIEVLVTTGVLGLILFLTWIGAALWRARNPLVLAALAGLAVEVVEPLNVCITVVVFLALGASGVRYRERPGGDGDVHPTADSAQRPLGVPGRLAVTLLTAGALALGTTMLIGDAAYEESPPHRYVAADAARANSLLWYWPQSAQADAEYHLYLSAISHDRSYERQQNLVALGLERQAAARAPFDAYNWVVVGRAYGLLGELTKASAAFHTGLDDDPWNVQALQGLATVAVRRHEWNAAAGWLVKERSVVPPGVERETVTGWITAVHDHRVPKFSAV